MRVIVAVVLLLVLNGYPVYSRPELDDVQTNVSSRPCPSSNSISLVLSSTAPSAVVAEKVVSYVSEFPRCLDVLSRCGTYLVEHHATLPTHYGALPVKYFLSGGSLIPFSTRGKYFMSNSMTFLTYHQLRKAYEMVGHVIGILETTSSRASDTPLQSLSSAFSNFRKLLAATSPEHFATPIGLQNIKDTLADVDILLSRTVASSLAASSTSTFSEIIDFLNDSASLLSPIPELSRVSFYDCL